MYRLFNTKIEAAFGSAERFVTFLKCPYYVFIDIDNSHVAETPLLAYLPSKTNAGSSRRYSKQITVDLGLLKCHLLCIAP